MKSYTLAVLVACSLLLTACGKGDEPRSSSSATPAEKPSDKTATSGTFEPSSNKTY